ncbi:MerC domain-containing protein [Chitinophaga sancti]|uniref:MerC domain-containing protein n=1 Tax=Chitinophaga sancti TaxID=1004 RepID=A0A1K1SN70_9BACT|nr:MerC domain-containing protein [Chitinophaga sancti]WQD63899.1 MerC domain-containing protein [Chitinophaga sancti]WQG90476.1 MerC domain-containing protein [Chitinophaga sancti]SFW85333.1 MerC mercury resistance protein [Chitinophaga sancti]
MNTDYRSRWDAIGIVASFACAIHCVLLPLIFTTLTLFGVEFLENVYLETLTILVSMCAGSWALFRGFKHHHNRTLIIIFFTGLTLMITGNLLSFHFAEIICKLAGSTLIIIAHLKNVRECRHE